MHVPHSRREASPTAIKGLGFIFGLVAVILLLTALALTQRSQTGPLVAEQEPDPIHVAVEAVIVQNDVVLEKSFSGLVAARRNSALGFLGSGPVASIDADIGDRVRKGARLAQLDVRNTQAELAAAQARVSEAQAGLALATATVSRQQALKDRGHVSSQRVDEARAQADVAAARVKAATAGANALRVVIDLASIEAPFDGVITARYLDEGAIAAAGRPVLELVELDALEALVGLPARDAVSLDADKDYVLTSHAGPIHAKLRATTGVVDPQRRTVTAIFDLEPKQDVPVGTVVSLSLDDPVVETGFWVPVGALTEASRGLWSIYRVDRVGDGHVVMTERVDVLHARQDAAFVRGGLAEGALYVSDGLQRIAPGQRVTPVRDAPDRQSRYTSAKGAAR